MADIGKMGEFDPIKESFVTYLKRLKLYFLVNNTDKEKQKNIFLLLMGTKIYEILTNLVMPKQPEELKFEEIEEVLKKHFQPTRLTIVERFQFWKKEQAAGQTVNEYAIELKKMAIECKFEAFLEQALRDRFITGLRNEKIQKEIMLKERTFNEALTLATSLELVDKEAKGMQEREINYLKRNQKEGRKCRNEKGDEKSKENWKKNEERDQEYKKCKCCGKPHLGKCRYVTYSCKKCGKVGHLQRVCDSKKSIKFLTDTDHSEKENEQSEDSDVGEKLYFVRSHKIFNLKNPFVVEVEIDFERFRMEVDTGASISIICDKTYKAKFSKFKLSSSKTSLRTFSGGVLKVLGEIYVPVMYGNVCKKLSLIVVQGDCIKPCPLLMGRNWIKELKVKLEIVNKISTDNQIINEIINEFRSKFKVFSSENGKFKDFKVDLVLEGKPTPIFCKARPVPYSLRTAVAQELDRLEKLGIMEKIKHSKWASPIVVVEKGKGEQRKIRICGDYKVSINSITKSEHYPLPNPSEIFNKLKDGKIYTVLDLSNAYQQLELSPRAQELLTVNTHQGLYRYKRMPFGITSAPAIFQATMDKILNDVENAVCYIDDILICGKNLEDCKRNVENVLRKLDKAGFKVQFEKCKFFRDNVNYLGFEISAEGIRPTVEGIAAIMKAPKPHDLTSLRSFLGMLNFYGRFLPNLSAKLHPLYRLLEKENKWNWTKSCDECFTESKMMLRDCGVLTIYDPEKPLILTCDASKYGIGAVLAQVVDNFEKPIYFASRTLNNAEKNYSQLEKEALAIIFAVRKFHLYLYGRKFFINSDHKPLQTIFHPNKSIPSLAAARIQRWALILAGYDYEIKYKKGTEIAHADSLSRLPLPEIEPMSKAEINYFSTVNELPISADEIEKYTRKDQILLKVYDNTLNGWKNYTSDDNLKPYFLRQSEISIDKNCLLWGRRVIIPEKLRSKILQMLHEQHPGIVRSKLLTRSYVWWPKIDEDLEKLIRSCDVCQKVQNANPTLKTDWPKTTRIFQRIHIDFAKKDGNDFLILIDSFSKWVEINLMTTTTTEATIEYLRSIFARYGLPEQLVSDNGPQLISMKFEGFCQQNGIKHMKTPPYHARSNGAAERTVQIIKKQLAKTKLENTVQQGVQYQLDNILFAYRNTPQITTEKTPAELFLKRSPRTRLSILKEKILKKEEKKNIKVTSYEPEELVYVKSKRGEEEKWLEGKILHRNSELTYFVLSNGMRSLVHAEELKKRQCNYNNEGVHNKRTSVEGSNFQDVNEECMRENQTPIQNPIQDTTVCESSIPDVTLLPIENTITPITNENSVKETKTNCDLGVRRSQRQSKAPDRLNL